MIRLLLLFLFTTSWTFLHAQREMDIEYYKQGYFIVYGHMQSGKGYCDTCIVEEGPYVDNRKEGLWLKYYTNGNVKLQGEYQRGRPDGKYKKYYANGCLKEEGTWHWKKQRGDFKTYYPDEQLSCSKFFNDDGRQINFAYFYKKNGCLDKVWEYHHPGNLNSEVRFSNLLCNQPCDTVDVGEDVHFIDTTKKKFNPIVYHPIDDHQGNCEYYYEIEAAGDGDHQLYNSSGDLIVDGEVEDGWVIKGKMYCYTDEKVKIYKYKNGKLVKHYWRKK